MKIKPAALLRQITDKLAMNYPPDEAEALARVLLREYLTADRAKLMINEELDIDESLHLLLTDAVKRLASHEPVQHILGYAHFYGRDFIVNENVLIPRPETEELVDLIIQRFKRRQNLDILDIGTGSGCIPVTLKKELPSCLLTGVDVSAGALKVAKANAKNHHAEVDFTELDILSEIPNGTYDIVISNPPYITDSERSDMERNVLEHEPGLALFVPDADPLLFYRRIAALCGQILRPGGSLFFEISEYYGEETRSLFKSYGFSSVELIKDLNGKDRILSGIKP
ncbi:MAG: peptide chain release factor N(5)-glutamine methyltransferase [Cyclobacteriaceae bacterium]